MLKNLTVGIFLLISACLMAQEGTTSPYSFYGIGSVKFRGTMENRMMGGLNVFSDSIHLNLQNPAGYSELKLVNYSLGASHQYSVQETLDAKQKTSTTTLDYFALGIPMGKFGAGFGILPYSSSGYHFLSDNNNGLTEYSGTGGLNRTYVSLGYKIIPELSIGVDARFNFGKIKNSALSQSSIAQYGTRVVDESEISGFNFNFGATYKKMINSKLEVTGSATYAPGSKFNTKNTRKISTVAIRPGGVSTVDERDILRPDEDFTFPSEFTLGLGLSYPKHWGVGVEYTSQSMKDFSNTLFDEGSVTFKNASKFRAGGFFIPNYNAFGNYAKRVVYRAGMRFEESGMQIDGHDINEFGISFGIGLPLGRLFSNVNIGLEYGQRATKDYGLVKENFFNTIISFSLNDRWFDKRLLD